MIINGGYGNVSFTKSSNVYQFRKQAATGTTTANTPPVTKPMVESHNSDGRDGQQRRVRVGMNSAMLNYAPVDRQSVRINFQDGSYFVGTYYDRTV